MYTSLRSESASPAQIGVFDQQPMPFSQGLHQKAFDPLKSAAAIDGIVLPGPTFQGIEFRQKIQRCLPRRTM